MVWCCVKRRKLFLNSKIFNYKHVKWSPIQSRGSIPSLFINKFNEKYMRKTSELSEKPQNRFYNIVSFVLWMPASTFEYLSFKSMLKMGLVIDYVSLELFVNVNGGSVQLLHAFNFKFYKILLLKVLPFPLSSTKE